MDFEKLKIFDLSIPGHWIEVNNRDKAFKIFNLINLVQGLFTEAVSAYALFSPITAESILNNIEKNESQYERCLNSIYAKTFVYSLDGIEKLLNRLIIDLDPPLEVNRLYEEYRNKFGHLKHIRDSAIHLEDRGRGLNRYKEALDTHIIVIGCFIENRFSFTGEDGIQYEIEISDKTLNCAKEIIQQIVNAFTWS